MAFKSLSQYQEDKNGDFFVLPNDGDYADVVFLYKSVNDVLVADVHYINTTSYKGYVHCCGAGCPACNHGEKGIRTDHKIFIPLYNINKNKIEFWDRTTYFEQVLQKSVFGPFPNPSEAVFRITRHGEAGSRDTKYQIEPKFRNSSMPYEKILADFNITLPEGYSAICKEMSIAEMTQAFNSTASASNLEDYGYTPVPRGAAASQAQAELPSIDIPTPEYSAPPSDLPVMPEMTAESSNANIETPADDSSDSLDDVKF